MVVVEGKHNLVIEGEGDVQVIEFIADRAENFNMWCEVRDHRARGREGRLIVS